MYMSKFLFMRNGALGDVILTTGIIREFCKINNCKVDVQTGCVDVFRNNPYIENIVSNPNYSNYEKVFDLNWVSEKNGDKHSMDAFSEFVFGYRNTNVTPELFALESDEVLDVPSPYVVFHLRRHHGISRNLPEKFYIEIIKGVLNNTNMNIVVIGSSSDIRINGDRIIDKVNMLSLQQSYCLIKNAKCFVGADSAPIHIAACTQTPLLAFFTQSHHERREAKYRKAKHISVGANIECYGCLEKYYVPPFGPYDCHRGDGECVNRFDATTVTKQILELIN